MSRSTARPSNRASSLVTLTAALLMTALSPSAASAGFVSVRNELVYMTPSAQSDPVYHWHYMTTYHEDITIHNWSSHDVYAWAIRKYVDATPEDLVTLYPNADGSALVDGALNLANSEGHGSFGYALSPFLADLETGDWARGHAWSWLFGEEAPATEDTTERPVSQEYEVVNGCALPDMHWWVEVSCNDRTFVVESEEFDFVSMHFDHEWTGSRALIVTDEMCEGSKDTYKNRLGHYSDGDDISFYFFPESRYEHDRAIFNPWSNTDTKGNKYNEDEPEGALRAAMKLAYPDHAWQATECGDDAVAARTTFKTELLGSPYTKQIDHYRAQGSSKASFFGMNVVVFGDGDTITCDDSAGFGVDCEDNLKRRYFCPQA